MKNLSPKQTARALDLSSATVADTERRLSQIELGLVADRAWSMVDVGMRLAWLNAVGAAISEINPLVYRFRALEKKR